MNDSPDTQSPSASDSSSLDDLDSLEGSHRTSNTSNTSNGPSSPVFQADGIVRTSSASSITNGLDEHCLNCDTPLVDNFCAKCGQEDKPVKRFFLDLISEALEGVFTFNSRTWATLIALFFKPGHLSNEYLAGRRVSYLPPVRVFLVFSLGYFLLLSLQLFISSLTSDFIPPDLELRPDGTVVTSDGEIAAVSQADFVGPRRFPALERLDLTINDGDGDGLSVPELVAETIDQIELPFIGAANNENFQQFLKSQARTNVTEIFQNPMEFVAQLLEYLPIMVLIFMPMLAIVQKIIYLGSGRYYVEHLVLTIHNHSFVFFALIASMLLGYLSVAVPLLAGIVNPINSLISIWSVVYLFLSFRRFFKQSWLMTTIRFLLVFSIYLIIILAGLLMFLIVEFFIY